MNPELLPPVHYFGGKARIAPVIWQALGDPALYIENCFGMGAVYRARPHAPRREIINDADGFVVNFWRAVQRDPEAVAQHVEWPVYELDLIARHRWLCQHARKAEFLERMRCDPDYFDASIAGRWAWGFSLWLGSGFTVGEWFGPGDPRNHGAAASQIKKPKFKSMGMLSRTERQSIPDFLRALSRRMEKTIVLCGDWSRCFMPSDLDEPEVAIFLDPPYDVAGGRDDGIYSSEMPSTEAVQAWCVEHGERPNLRIVLAGYEGEYKLPGWKVIGWGRTGTWLSAASGKPFDRERLWLSPGCLPIRRPIRGYGRSPIWHGPGGRPADPQLSLEFMTGGMDHG